MVPTADFKDLTTMKNMFLARYNPWGKTKRDQLQSWNNLSFDLQKTDIDEQINLVLTLANMLKQDKQAKMDKFIETMPTIIETHLIIAPNWKEVTKKAKNLEHIIRRCEQPAIAPPISQGAGAVPSLYSHIAQSQDQDSTSLPKPFKSARGHRGKKVKVKPNHNSNLHHLPLPLNMKNSIKMQIITTTMRIIEGTIETVDPTGANRAVESQKEDLNKGEGDNKIIIEANTKATTDNSILPVVAIIIITMAITIFNTIVDLRV